MEGIAVLTELIHQNRISMRLTKVPSNPVLGRDEASGGIEHYRLQLQKPDKELEVYLSLHPEEGALTLADALLMLAMDASGCMMFEGLDAYREVWHAIADEAVSDPEEMEFFWDELTGRCKQAEGLKHFLGDSAYDELLFRLGMKEALFQDAKIA